MPGTFDVESARRAGYSDAEIAYYLGGEYEFDVQGAQAAGYSFKEIANYLATTPAKKPGKGAERGAPVEETLVEKIPFVGKPLAALADVPLGIAKGVISGGEIIAGAAGAGTEAREALGKAREYVGEFMSAASRRDAQEQSRIMKEAEDEGVLGQVLAGVKAFGVAPIDTLTQALGTAAAPIAAAAGAAYAGAPAAVVGTVGAGLGAVMGAGATKNAIYDAVRDEYIKAGVPKEKAEAIADEAQEYAGENFGQILLGGGLGALTSTTGIEAGITKIVGQRVFGRLAAKEAGEEAAKGVGRRAAATGFKEGAPEFIQGAQEQLAQNLALQREGFDVDTMRGVVGAGTLEGLAGAGLGTMTGAAEALGDRQLTREAQAEAKRVETAALRAGMAPEEAAFEAEVARLRVTYNMKPEIAAAVARANLESAATKEAADVGTATVPGGAGAGVPAAGGAPTVEGAAGVAPPAGGGGLGDVGTAAGPDISGEGAQQRPLAKVTGAQIKETVPTIEQAFTDAAIDFEENYGVKKLNAEQKKQAARIVLQSPEVDAYDAITSVIERGMQLRGEEVPVRAPVAPSVDEVATEPVKSVIETVAEPTPGAVVPSVAEATAQQAGLAPSAEEKIAAKRAELAAQAAADAEAEALLREDMARRAAEEALPAPATVEETVTETEIAPAEEAAPVAEEVVQETVQEAEPDDTAYDDILNEIEDARWDEEAGQQIDDKTYNLLANAAENRRGSVEDIRAGLEAAKTRYAERAIGGERFRPGEPGNVTVEQVAPIVTEAAQRTGVQAPRVVQSVTELPPALQQAVTRGGTVSPSGVVDTDGNVFIVADNLNTPEEATATLFHETLGHIGLAKQFRQRLDKALRTMYDTNRALRAEVDAWRQQHPDAYREDPEPLARAVEEVLARRSEGGRIEAGFFAKLAAVVKDFARRMRIKAAFSDAEINAILAMAHDRAVREARGVGPESPRFQARKTKKAEKAAKKAEKSDKKISRGLRKVQLSNMAEGFPGEDVRDATKDVLDEGIGSTIEGHSTSDFIDGLKDNYNAIGDTMLKYLLYFLPSDAIVGWKESEVPALRRLATLEDEMRAERNAYLNGFSKMAQRFGKFVSKNGQKVLGSTMHLARINRVDPTAHDTVAEAVQNDPIIKRYKALIAAKGTTPKQKAAYKGKLTQRTTQIEEVYDLWEQLGKQPGGHKQYIEIRQFYKDMYTTTRTLLDEQIEELDIDPASKQALLRSVRLEREKERESRLEQDDEYPEIDAAEFPEQYFPFKRYGDYWLRVGKGETGREFYTFETARERNKFLRQRARELNLSVNDARFRKGNDITSLRQEFTTDSAMLQKMFSIIDNASAQGSVNVGAIKDQLYQVYLMTLPERSIRKQFLHADNVTGFSGDVFRNFKTTAFQYANQLVSLRYNRKIDNTIEEARASLEGFPPNEEARLESFVNEIGDRAKGQVNPAEAGAVVRTLNRAAFVWYLTSAATAITQVSGIPIRVMPRLWTDYGYGKASAMLAKYSKFWDSVGIVEEDEGELTYTGPTIGESQFVRSNPVLKRAFAVARDERSVFETQAAGILDSRATPTRASKFAPGQLSEATVNGMSVLFNTSERVTREMTFMMAFELEYNKTKDFDASVDKAVAIVNDTLGNYSDFNRPRFMKGDLGRALFLFKQYAVNTTVFFYNNMRRIVTGGETGFFSIEDRAKAMNELVGVLLMGGLFHGITGFPLYSLLTTIIDMLESDDDDEEAQLRRYRNPYTANNSDYRFRYEWLPSKFGDITIPGIDGEQHRLSDILMNGPISELSDVNIASRTSFDGLWFREGKAADTPTDAIMNAVVANVPGLSLVTGTAEGLKDIYNGDVNRGIERVLPAAFRGTAGAYRLATEGAETRGELPMLSKEELSDMNLIAQVLGFGSTKLGQIQKERASRDKLFRSAAKERTGLMRDLNEAMYTAASDPEGGQERMLDALQEIYDYNAKHPVPPLAITRDTVEDSYEAFLRERKYQMRGSTFTKKEAPFALPGIQAAAPE